MHMMSRKDFSSEELDTLRRSRNPTAVLQAMKKCIQTRRNKFSFTIKIHSWLCNCLKKRLLFYRLENSAKTTDILMSESAVKNNV